MKGSHIGSVCDAFMELSKKLNGVMCSLDSKSIDVYNSRLHGHVVAHPIRELGFAVFVRRFMFPYVRTCGLICFRPLPIGYQT